MGLGAVIAVAGLLSTPVPQALALAAAVIIAPAFEPVAKLAVGLVRGSWYTVRRALIAIAGGYALLAIVGALTYLLLHGLDMANSEVLAGSEGTKMVVHPTGADWLISAGGAAAGMIIVSAFRQAVIAGALIALALVPAAALIGADQAAGQTTMALEGHCCIERSAHSSWSHLPAQKPHGRARMPSLSWFSGAIVGPALLL